MITLLWVVFHAHRFDSAVTQGDVDEALRLMRASKSSLADNGGDGGARKEDPVSLCYRWDRAWIGFMEANLCRGQHMCTGIVDPIPRVALMTFWGIQPLPASGYYGPGLHSLCFCVMGTTA
jgi:hypothetical protein